MDTTAGMSISGRAPPPTQFSQSHSFQPGRAIEGLNAEGGPQGKNEELGLLGSGPLPLEQLARRDLPGSSLGVFRSKLKTLLFEQAFPPAVS